MSKARARRPHRVTGPFCASNPTAPVRHRRGAHGSCRHVSIGDDGGDGGVRTSRSARRGWRTSEWRESCTAGERGVRYEMKSSALKLAGKTDVIPNKTNVMTHPLR